MKAPRAHVLAVLTSTWLAVVGVASPAAAQIFDARSMGMGGATLPGPEASRVNPARHAVPRIDADAGTSIPLPIGLIGVLADPPVLDPDDPDFDFVELLDFALAFPWALQLGAPSTSDDDVVVDVSRDAVIIDLQDARDRIPSDDFDLGHYRTLFVLGRDFALGPRYGHLYVGALEAWQTDLLEVELDPATRGVLADREAIVGGRTYAMRARGSVQSGLSSSLAYAREITLPGAGRRHRGDDWLDAYWESEQRRPRLWVGVGVRRYFGIAAARLDGDVTLTAEEPLLADTSTFDLRSQSDYVRATPRGLAGLGTAWALDLGAVLRWREFELGAGVADLFADLTYDHARVDVIEYDDTTDGFDRRPVARRTEATFEIPVSWRTDLVWRRDARTTFVTDLDRGPGGVAWHLGAERWIDGGTALRGGVEHDRRGRWQGGAGVGLRWSRIGLDFGLRSHSRNFSGQRVLELGVALVLGGAAR